MLRSFQAYFHNALEGNLAGTCMRIGSPDDQISLHQILAEAHFMPVSQVKCAPRVASTYRHGLLPAYGGHSKLKLDLDHLVVIAMDHLTSRQWLDYVFQGKPLTGV